MKCKNAAATINDLIKDNRSLSVSKAAKKDEFYTLLSTVENELVRHGTEEEITEKLHKIVIAEVDDANGDGAFDMVDYGAILAISVGSRTLTIPSVMSSWIYSNCMILKSIHVTIIMMLSGLGRLLSS